MKKIASLAVLALSLVLVTGAFAQQQVKSAPKEGTIWDHKGVNAFGDAFQTSLMIRHGHLIIILSKGGQLDWGVVKLNEYNEYEVPSKLFQRAFPAVATMTYKFSEDFESVTETDVMDYKGRCVQGDCANNISTTTYRKR